MRVCLYGEINMNLIDGSSAWVQSVAQVLTAVPGVEVQLVLRFPEEREVLTQPLRSHPRIKLVGPPHDRNAPLTPPEAIDLLETLDAEERFDLILLRGLGVSAEAARRRTFDGRLWVYYLPSLDRGPGAESDQLQLLASACARILCQTEPIRAVAEAALPEDGSKLILLPPMIPECVGRPPGQRSGPMKVFYAGKFAPEYSFLEMVEMFRRLRESAPDAELHLVGDKIHDPPDDPGFRPAAEAALAKTENLVWHGGVSRQRVGELLAEADLALSLRHAGMTRSKELSTKVLEYGAAGCAVLLNRTPLYEELLGADYPLFAADPSDGLDALRWFAGDRGALEEAARRCHAAAQGFSFESIGALLEPYLAEHSGGGDSRPGRVHPHLLFAGHDLKFLAQIPDHARAAGAEIREDRWEAHEKHSAKASAELVEWADIVLCEWCLGNAVWYSRHKRDGQRLVVRYHRVERETTYPESVAIDTVDCIVFVGRHLLDEAAERFSWPEEKLRVVPNAVDMRGLHRLKLSGSSFNLGLIGYVPSRKRFDRALDILELLRAHDPRYRLIVKGQPPWAYPWVMRRDEERSYFQEVNRRITLSPLLREAVTFEEFGRNIPAFLRKVGVILSTGDHEGHQVALAEGMASGSVPVVIERPGAREQYTDDWVHDSSAEAAAAVLELAAAQRVEQEGLRAARYAERWSIEAITPLWDDVLGLEQPG
jgi:glycosyltransferase involved in cell wall biosynthesis